MKFLTHKVITSLLIISSLNSSAQVNYDSTIDKTSATRIVLGTGYVSKLHYYGRTDSLKSSALVPSVAVQFANGLYAASSFIFIRNAQSNLAYTAVITEAGVKFGKDKGMAGSIFIDKFFYANNSTLVQSVQKGQAGLNLSHLNSLININTSASAVFSDKTDFFANAGIDHSFRIEHGKSVFLIAPSLTSNFGTQNFTKTYYQKRNVLFLPIGEQEVTENGQKFQLLSYEASLPITFAYNKLAIRFVPSYVIPQNVITIANRPDLSENASKLFYGNVGVSYTLGR